ncbi:unnamed protein product [Lampetra planeri]
MARKQRPTGRAACSGAAAPGCSGPVFGRGDCRERGHCTALGPARRLRGREDGGSLLGHIYGSLCTEHGSGSGHVRLEIDASGARPRVGSSMYREPRSAQRCHGSPRFPQLFGSNVSRPGPPRIAALPVMLSPAHSSAASTQLILHMRRVVCIRFL